MTMVQAINSALANEMRADEDVVGAQGVNARVEPGTVVVDQVELFRKGGGAKLFVDGVLKGTTPVTVDVARGSHTLRVELDGFPTKTETIDLSDLQSGETRRRVIALQ